jgi:DNA repair exonuclease SbcCD ATPase subunit
MIIFNKIRFRNFLSTGNIFVEIDLSSFNSTLVLGINGAGKSTLLDALTYVLFNKSYRHINKPQLLNSISKRNLLVELEFLIGDKNYLIRRGMVPNIFEIYHDGVLLNQAADSRDYQEILEKQILKTNYKTFCQVVILGSATYESFMRLAAAQKRIIIEDLLDLEIFTYMNLILKQKIIDNENNINNITIEKNKLENKLKLLQDHVSYVNSNNEQTIKEYENLNKKLEKQIDELRGKIRVCENSISELNEKIQNESEFNNKLNKLSSYKHKLNAKLDLLNKENEFFKIHDMCPTCSQNIDMDFKTRIISELKDNIKKYEINLEELNKKVEEISIKLLEIKQVKSKISTLKLNIQHHGSEVLSLLQKKDNNNSAIKKYTDTDVSVLDTIEETKSLLEQCKKDYHEVEEAKVIYNVVSKILKDNGVKSKIIKQYIPIINRFINRFLSELEFFGTFELDENFKETIKSRYRDTFSYESFSMGERFRIDIALLFTWREISKYRNSISTNLLIMDEVFDGPLDFDGIDYMFKMFENMKKTNIFVITPKGENIETRFNRVITFHKNKNFSEIL